ncbi:unnamed protein product, partial [Meganyctiphanes norvegica]
ILPGRNLSLLFGLSASDGLHELGDLSLTQGLTLQERNRILRTLVRNTYRRHLQEIYLAVTKEYTDWANGHRLPHKVLEQTVLALGDAGYLAPFTKFGEALNDQNSQAFMYYFTREDTKLQQSSMFGSELPLLFGAPFMADPGPWKAYNLTPKDAATSQLIMTYWTNFAKTGNPNMPWLSSDDTTSSSSIWKPYDVNYQRYLQIGGVDSAKPRPGSHLRSHHVALWNWLIPQLEDTRAMPSKKSQDWQHSEDEQHFVGQVRPLDPFRFLQSTQNPLLSGFTTLLSTTDNYYAVVTAVAKTEQDHMNGVSSDEEKGFIGKYLDYSSAITLTIAIGLSLLFLNAVLFLVLIYKWDRHSREDSKYDGVVVQPLCTIDNGQMSSHTPVATPGENRHVPFGTADIMYTELATPGENRHVPYVHADLMYTELKQMPTPPDIGDRNSEVQFKKRSSLKKSLAQPTSQFIPPPPLLGSVFMDDTRVQDELDCDNRNICDFKSNYFQADEGEKEDIKENPKRHIKEYLDGTFPNS